MNNLQLSLKNKWFEMTKAGIKTEDYREITPYWLKRLFKYDGYVLLDDSMVDEVIYELSNGKCSISELLT